MSKLKRHRGAPPQVGRYRKPNAVQPRPTTRVEIVRQLFDAARERKIGTAVLAHRMNISNVSVSRWKHGWATPSARHLELLAAAVGCRLTIEEE